MEKEKKLNTLSYVFLTIAVISGILVCLLLSNLIPVQAKDVGFSPTYPYMFESYWDSDLVFGASNLIYKNDKYYDPTDNPDGVLQLSYPMSAGSNQWTGTFKSYGWSDSDIAFVRGSILNDNAWATVKVSTDNWISSVALRHMNPDDDVHAILYFRGFSSADQSTAEYAFVSYNWGIRVGFDKVLVGDGEYQLFKWNAGTSTWDTVSLYATQALMDDLTILAVNDVTGMEWINLAPNGSVNINRAKFTLDPADEPDEPTPTPEPPESVFFKFSYDEGGTIYYKLVEINAEDFGFSVPLERVNSSFLSFVASNHGVQLESLSGASFVMRTGSSGYNINTTGKNAFWVYFTAESVNYIKIYSIPDVTSYAKEPLELIDTYTGSDLPQYPNYFCQFASPTVSNVFGLVFSQAKVSTPNWIASYTLGDVYGFDYVLQSISSTSVFNADGNYYSNSESSNATWVIAYDGLYGLLGSLEPEPNPNGPTPTPTPTLTPTPSPTPTEAPHVIINWPTSTPTPTPFPLDFTMPTLPGGDLKPHTTENVLSQGLEQIRLHLNTGLLATAFSYVPPELQFLIWFLVFVLLLLAVVKLIIHFGG